jgi:hypothetical protein
MQRRVFFVLTGFACFVFAITLALYADDTATAKTSGLVDDLTKNLSLKPEQAMGAAGSVFSLAKSKMNAADFTKLAGGFPEMDSLLSAAPKASSSATGALGSAAGGAVGLASQFSSLGISPETATKVVPEVLNFVKAKQGDEMMGLLSKAIK